MDAAIFPDLSDLKERSATVWPSPLEFFAEQDGAPPC